MGESKRYKSLTAQIDKLVCGQLFSDSYQSFKHLSTFYPQNFWKLVFLSDPGVPGVRSMGPVVSNSLQDLVVDLTDVTLVDEDTNSIPTNNNRTIQDNVAMPVSNPGDQFENIC